MIKKDFPQQKLFEVNNELYYLDQNYTKKIIHLTPPLTFTTSPSPPLYMIVKASSRLDQHHSIPPGRLPSSRKTKWNMGSPKINTHT